MHTYPQSLSGLSGWQWMWMWMWPCGWMWAAQTSWKSFMSSKLISFDFAPGMLHLGWDDGNWFWSCWRYCCFSQVTTFAWGHHWDTYSQLLDVESPKMRLPYGSAEKKIITMAMFLNFEPQKWVVFVLCLIKLP